ncbi:MAG: hypothetical protein AAB389_00750 [Patescibacteria group bacterium]
MGFNHRMVFDPVAKREKEQSGLPDQRADQLTRIKKALAKIKKMSGSRGKRMKLDLEDAVVVLETMVKEPSRFMKAIRAIPLNFEKYEQHRGLN